MSGRRRGYSECIVCHAIPGGSVDIVQEEGAPETPTAIDFRSLLHKIHRGRDLEKMFGSVKAVGFPAFPSGTKDCETCHGIGNPSWEEPHDRTYPGSSTPAQVWRVACSACHDGDAKESHMDANTSPGEAEICGICHAPGRD